MAALSIGSTLTGCSHLCASGTSDHPSSRQSSAETAGIIGQGQCGQRCCLFPPKNRVHSFSKHTALLSSYTEGSSQATKRCETTKAECEQGGPDQHHAKHCQGLRRRISERRVQGRGQHHKLARSPSNRCGDECMEAPKTPYKLRLEAARLVPSTSRFGGNTISRILHGHEVHFESGTDDRELR